MESLTKFQAEWDAICQAPRTHLLASLLVLGCGFGAMYAYFHETISNQDKTISSQEKTIQALRVQSSLQGDCGTTKLPGGSGSTGPATAVGNGNVVNSGNGAVINQQKPEGVTRR